MPTTSLASSKTDGLQYLLSSYANSSLKAFCLEIILIRALGVYDAKKTPEGSPSLCISSKIKESLEEGYEG